MTTDSTEPEPISGSLEPNAAVDESPVDEIENLNTQEAILLSSLRNYDVLLAILTVLDKDAAQKLYEAHEDGNLVGPSLFYNPVPPQTIKENNWETD